MYYNNVFLNISENLAKMLLLNMNKNMELKQKYEYQRVCQ